MLRITAIIACYNEADIIGQSVGDLVRQGIRVHVLDNHSTDGTVDALIPYLGTGLVQIERFPADAPSTPHRYEHARIMTRKQQLAVELDADWFISHDADEFRESPWSHLTLREGIERIDRYGYTAIDFVVLNFQPTHDGFDPSRDIRNTFQYYEAAGPWDRTQVKCWKKATDVELVSSGGHDARFASRLVCPIRFLLRHYPIRGQAHGERKIFQDRKPCFADEDVQRGWHVQYDNIAAGHAFVRDPQTLRLYDPELTRFELMLRHRTVEELEAALALERDQQTQLTSALSQERLARADVDDELSRTRSRLEELSAAFSAAGAEADVLREELSMRAEQARVAARELDTRARELTQKNNSIEGLTEGLEARLSEVEGLRRTTEQQARHITDLYNSKSWRATRPLRALYEVVTATAPAHRIVKPVPDAPSPPQWGDLARLSPVSDRWGTDRGLPVDRHYIHRFLDKRRNDIQGRVLEIKDSHYATAFGRERVREVEILDIDQTNPHATLIADLSSPSDLPGDRFDCFILTQTLHIIYDIKSALVQAERLLAPGGVLLCTIPAVSRVNYEDGGLENGDFWRLTRAAVLRLFAEVFDTDQVQVETYGNIRVCTAFLYGLAEEDLSAADFAYDDPWFPLIHCVRAVKRPGSRQ